MSTNRDTSAHDTYWRLRTLPSRSVSGCPANEHYVPKRIGSFNGWSRNSPYRVFGQDGFCLALAIANSAASLAGRLCHRYSRLAAYEVATLYQARLEDSCSLASAASHTAGKGCECVVLIVLS